MSTGAAAPLRTVAFGDLATGIWGVAWGTDEVLLALGLAQAGQEPAAVSASIIGSAAGEEWSLAGPGVELTVSPETEAGTSEAIGGFDQLCRVYGRAVFDGAERELGVLGRRACRPAPDLGRIDSIRDVSAWFAADDGVALTSLRPRGAKGQDRDIIGATVFEPAAPVPVADPRLSTTYTADGHPTRVGLELWLDREDSEEQYPRRAAGEPLGASAVWTQPTIELEAHLQLWRSRGEEGIGVYVLVRPR